MLARALGFAAWAKTNNVFYGGADLVAWLSEAERVVGICNEIRNAAIAAESDVARIQAAMESRAARSVDMLTDLYVWMSAVKAGLVLRVPAEMMLPPKYNVQFVSGRVAVGGISLQQPDQEKVEREVEEWAEDYKEHIKKEMEGAIKDMSMQEMLRIGVSRRRDKLAHDYTTLEKLVFDELYVPMASVGEYIRQLIHMGAWQDSSQGAFERYAKIFLANMPWSSYAMGEASVLARLRSDLSWIGSNAQGERYLRIVDAAIRVTGGRGV